MIFIFIVSFYFIVQFILLQLDLKKIFKAQQDILSSLKNQEQIEKNIYELLNQVVKKNSHRHGDLYYLVTGHWND